MSSSWTCPKMSKCMFNRTFPHDDRHRLNLPPGNQVEEDGQWTEDRRKKLEGSETETQSLNGAETLGVCREYQITPQRRSFGVKSTLTLPTFPV